MERKCEALGAVLLTPNVASTALLHSRTALYYSKHPIAHAREVYQTAPTFSQAVATRHDVAG
jgi:hypothetical protein